MDVEVLELHRRGQQDVGIVGRVGGELLMNDGEQVLAPQSRENARLVGTYRRRVRVVDVDSLDRRRQFIVEPLPPAS